MLQSALQKLYDRDFVARCNETVTRLKSGQIEQLDFEGLTEEIAGLANRNRKELESRLRILLAHLLKCLYITSPNDFRSWEIRSKDSAVS